jgi:hypothetical protein
MNVDINGNGARSLRSGEKKETAIIIEDSEKQEKLFCVCGCSWRESKTFRPKWKCAHGPH